MRAFVRDGEDVDFRGVSHLRDWAIDDSSMHLPWKRMETEEFIWGLTTEQTRFAPEVCWFHQLDGKRAIAYQPLRRGGQIMGFVATSLESSAPPSKEQIQLSGTLAKHLMLALEMERLALAEKRSEQLAIATEAMNRAIDALRKVREPDQIVPRILEIVAEVFECTSCAVFKNEPSGRIRLLYWNVDGKTLLPPELMELDAEKFGLVRFLADGFEVPDAYLGLPTSAVGPAIVDHVAGTVVPEFDRFAIGAGWELELNIGVGLQELRMCTLCVYRLRVHPFSAEEIELATALANQIGFALETSRIADEAREAAVAREKVAAAERRAAELQKANVALTGSLGQLAQLNDFSSAVEVVLLEIAKQAGAELCYWFDYDAAANTLTVKHRIRHDRLLDGPDENEPEWMGSTFDADITQAFRFMLENDGMVILNQAVHSPLLWPGVPEWHLRNGRTESTAFAVKAGGEPLGVLGLAFTDRVTLSADQIELIRALSNQLAMAICSFRMSNRAQQEAVAAAVAVERQEAAELRAAEFGRANDSIRRSLDQLAGRDTLEGFIPQVLKEAMTAAGAEHGTLFRIRNRQMVMELYVDSSGIVDISADRRFEIWWKPVPFEQAPLAVQKLIDQKLIICQVPEQVQELWPPSVPWHMQMGDRTVAICPLSVGSDLFGFIGLGFTEPTICSPQRAELIQVLGQQASLAIHLNVLAELARDAAVTLERQHAAEQRAATLSNANRVLRNVNDRLTTILDLSSFGCYVLEELCHQVQSPLALVFELEPGGAMLKPTAYFRDGKAGLGVPSVPWLLPMGLVPAGDLWKMLCETRGPIEFEPCGRGPQPPLNVAKAMLDHGIRQSLNLPLISGDQVMGLVAVYLRDQAPLDPVKMELARSLAQHVSLGLKLTRLAEEVNRVEILAERNRIARDLHDTLAQSFTAILMQLQAASSLRVNQPQLALECTDRAEKLAREGLGEARQSVIALVPAESEGGDVVGPLHRLAYQSTAGTAAPCVVTIEGEPVLVPSVVAANLVRLSREALANAQRYAQASRIEMNLVFEGEQLGLRIADNGRGFNLAEVEDVGFGLAGMKARAERIGGEILIQTAPGEGTVIQVKVPLTRGKSTRGK